MSVKLPPAITRHWSINGTMPNPDQTYSHYGSNFQIGVEAQDMEAALNAARQVYPNARFISCSHRGELHIRATDQPK